MDNIFKLRAAYRASVEAAAKKDRFALPSLLSTGLTLLHRADRFGKLLEELETKFHLWHVRLTFVESAREVTRVVPNIFYSFNKSRVLRRLKITGIRACNITNVGHDSFRSINDIAFVESFAVVYFIEALFKMFPDWSQDLRVKFRYPRKRGGRSFRADLASDRQRIIADLYRMLGCRHDAILIEEVPPIDPDEREFFELVIIPKRVALFTLLQVLFDLKDFRGLRTGKYVEVSNVMPFFHLNDYHYIPLQNFNLPPFRHFTAFGDFYNNPYIHF